MKTPIDRRYRIKIVATDIKNGITREMPLWSKQPPLTAEEVDAVFDAEAANYGSIGPSDFTVKGE